MTDFEKEEMKNLIQEVLKETFNGLNNSGLSEDKRSDENQEDIDIDPDEVIEESEDAAPEEQKPEKIWREPTLIGIAGAKAGVGITHISLAILSELKRSGKNVVLLDMSESSDLSSFDSEEQEKLSIIPNATLIQLDEASYLYDIILIDLGRYCDDIVKLFKRCDYKVIVSGGATWEMHHLEKFFDDELKESIQFVFNCIPDEKKQSIVDGMNPLNVGFIDYIKVPLIEEHSDIVNIICPELEVKGD